MNSFERLQKEIDSLTYNARAVMHALQDSALSAGSSSGFKVIRAGKEITLSRVDIYRLYTFYKEWEQNNYSLEDVSATSSSKKINGFYTVLTNQNKTPVRDDLGNIISGTATSDALAKHGRIMYLNASNLDSYDNDQLWINLVATATNPKLVSNTAPIPINLRTPVLDPNLSTKHYNTHPTYLLPSGYYTPDILGYDGDGVNHSLAGDAWIISGTSNITINTPKFTVGAIDKNNIYKTESARVGTYSSSIGYDSTATGQYSFSTGYKSSASGDYSMAMGYQNLSSGLKSVAIGGNNNYAVGENATNIGGESNLSVGVNSFSAGGSNNSTTEPAYQFELAMFGGSTNNVCVATCVNACDGSTDTSTVISNPAYQVLRIKQNISTINFTIGDKVTLYDFTVSSDAETPASRLSSNGDVFPSLDRVIVSIATDSSMVNATIITLNMSVTKAHIIGGMIARKSVNALTTGGATSGLLGYNSATIGGIGLSASGRNQTVVGAYNYYKNDNSWDSTYQAKFIVGSGLASARKNSFEVYDNALFAMVNSSRYGTDGFSGLAIGYNKDVGTADKLNAVSMIWGQNTDKYSAITTSASGVLLASATNINVQSIGNTTLTNNQFSNTSINTFLKSNVTYISSKSKAYIDSASTVIGYISGQGAAIGIAKDTISIGFKKSIIVSGDRNGSYGYFISPISSGDSFTRFRSDGELITPNTIFKTSISEVLMPAESNLYLKSEYPPDTYMGLLDTNYLKKAHVLSFAGTKNAAGNGSIMQMMWGQCTPENIDYDVYNNRNSTSAWTGNICVRKGYIEDSGTGVWTTWEPLVTLSDVNSIIGDQFVSFTVGADSIYKLYQWRKLDNNGNNRYESADWVEVDTAHMSSLLCRFTQCGGLTTLECKFDIQLPTPANNPKDVLNNISYDAYYMRVIIAVPEDKYKFCKPYLRSHGSVVNGSGHLDPLKPESTYPLYAGYINGLINIGTGILGTSEQEFQLDVAKIDICIPVINVNETTDTVSGRFVATYKNLLKV